VLIRSERVRLEDCIAAMLQGAAIGDALGQPVESMWPEEILDATGGEGVSDFRDPLQTRIPDTRNLKAGDTTDDTQLLLAVAESLIASSGYDREHQARTHVETGRRSRVGWGGTTAKALDDLTRYFETQGQQGRSWEEPAPRPTDPRQGAGNGVAMKVAPLAVYHLVRLGPYDWDSLHRWVSDLATLTHWQPLATHAAFVYASVLQHVLQNPGAGLEWVDIMMQAAIQFGSYSEKELDPGKVEPTVSQQLRVLGQAVGDPDKLRREITPGFLASQSVIFALGVFLSYPRDFSRAVLAAVNAGGDADTTASLVGGLVGANCGLGAIPERWRAYNPVFSEAAAVGRRLFRSALTHHLT
jgi:ADP-ribosylglycohydrolase